ncbi:MAG: hypothetical protein J7K88_00995, partial [Candidatus Fermentibacteraceae bacterium]|nr:hypothetical protein [Candidatus Fermentibacteraceae bacterium]
VLKNIMRLHRREPQYYPSETALSTHFLQVVETHGKGQSNTDSSYFTGWEIPPSQVRLSRSP